MSLVPASSAFDSYTNEWRRERKPNLAKQLCDAGNFLRSMRIRMQFGELSRAPLKLLRLHIVGEVVKCDWLARVPDAWDADLAPEFGERHASLQALRDAIDVRELLFAALPFVETADFRVYRESADHAREMIITGCTQRNDNASRSVHSLAMRAKILGFRFQLEDEVLRKISNEDASESSE